MDRLAVPFDAVNLPGIRGQKERKQAGAAIGVHNGFPSVEGAQLQDLIDEMGQKRRVRLEKTPVRRRDIHPLDRSFDESGCSEIRNHLGLFPG
jgi:hypothetical protein